MDSSSLINKYNKINKENNTKKANSCVFKFILRMFISSLLLLSFAITKRLSSDETIRVIQSKISTNYNYTLMTNKINALFGNIIPNNDVKCVNAFELYDEYVFDGKYNIVKNHSFEGVKIIEAGIVSRVKENKDNSYNVLIEGIDNYAYEYINLKSFDFKIYSYIDASTIIGLAKKEDDYTFKIAKTKGEKYFEI